MRLNTSQQLSLQQQMKLSPRIIQAMEILQLPILALEERIEAEMESNPVLELKDGDGEAPEAGPADEATDVEMGEQALVVKETGDQADEFQRLARYEDEFEPWTGDGEDRPRSAAPDGERDRKMDAMANAPAPEQALDEYLLGQWAFIEAEAQIKEAGKLIISHIEEDGYIRTSLDDMARETVPTTPLATLEAALKLVQTLDPIGIGARDLRECLQIQLAAEAAAGRDVTLEVLLVERFLRDIEMNRLPAIARRTNREVADIKAALDVICHLNPRPGLMVGQRSAPIITPDVIVDLDDAGDVVVSMPDGSVPALTVSRPYTKLAKDRATARDARLFLQRNIRSAQWLIGAIQQRRETVRRVTFEVFRAQKDFLLHGHEALKPLPMQDVATKVGVHVATVSRAVSGKYVQTPRGIFPLRMFFGGGKTNAEGEDVAYDAIRVKLQELVNTEDKSSPLNDEKLAEAMAAAGITVARRTIAKYRDLLGIPPARKRTQY